MPLYEFRCQNCNAKFSILVKSVAEPCATACSSCGSEDVVRAMSSFAYHKSMSTIWEESGEPQNHPSLDYYKDPRNIGRWTEKRFDQMGLDVPPEVKEKIEAARGGELPAELKD